MRGLMSPISAMTFPWPRRPIPSQRFSRVLVLGVLLSDLFIAGIVALSLSQGLVKERNQAEVTTDNLSKVLEESIVGLIGGIDLTLLSVRDEVERQEAAGGIDAKAIEAVLARQDARIPGALGLRVVDAQGVIRHAVTGVVVSQASIADRPQFIRMRDDPQAGLVISKPVFGRAAQKWMVTLSRRLDNPDGTFAGDVHVAVTLDYFTKSFAALQLGPQGAVSLWDDSPTILARYSAAGGFLNQAGSITPSRRLLDLITSKAASSPYLATSGADGVARSFAFRRVGDYPLYLTVGLAEDDFLADWRRDAGRMIGLTVLFVLATVLAARILLRGWRHRLEYTAALESAKTAAEEARYRSDLILASAGEGICGVDPQGSIVFVNAAAREMLGWAADEGIGLNLHQTTHHHHADGSEHALGDCPTFKTVHDGETRHVADDVFWRKDGAPVRVAFTAAAIRKDREIVGAVTIFRDITDQRRLQDSLREKMLELDTILDNSSVGITYVKDRRQVWANQRMGEMFGYSLEDMANQSTSMFYTTPEAYERGASAYQALAQGERFTTEQEMRRRDGSHVWMRISGKLIPSGHSIGGSIWVFEDISDRRHAEEVQARNAAMLAQKNQELEQFAYVASHDLRQPLRMVSSYLALIERRLAGRLDEDERLFIGFAVDGAKRMDRMIVDLLDYSRIGRAPVGKSMISLEEVMLSAIGNLEAAIDDAGAVVTVRSALPELPGYDSELERLFQNLIANGIKFHAGDRRPEVTILCREEPQDWIVSVSDNGIGIAPKDYPRLFAVFQRLVSQEQYRGNGIGLATCRKIAEHHDGRIWVESEVGTGSTFHVALPKALSNWCSDANERFR